MKSAADGKELRSGTVVGATAPDTAFSEALTTVAGLCQALTQHLGTLQDPAPRLQPDIPTYRGYDDRLSVADFLDKLDVYKAAVGASDTHMLTSVLPLVFQGPAACWWRLQSPFASWATFVVSFRTEFLPPGYDTRILRELDLRTQHPNESLLEYVRAMQELYRRAAPETTSAEQVARVLRQCHPRFQPYLYAQTMHHRQRRANPWSPAVPGTGLALSSRGRRSPRHTGLWIRANLHQEGGRRTDTVTALQPTRATGPWATRSQPTRATGPWATRSQPTRATGPWATRSQPTWATGPATRSQPTWATGPWATRSQPTWATGPWAARSHTKTSHPADECGTDATRPVSRGPPPRTDFRVRETSRPGVAEARQRVAAGQHT
ncbi:uncharacterized protein LOC144174835 isoform X2 [Haemaphysalis longicornis]